jgi:hypothetical protein
MPGPIGKKDAERRRRNKDAIPTELVNVDELLVGEVEIPIADENWEPLTKSFYDSFKSSGQVIWMEPTDWMTAYTLMEVLDRWLKPQDVKVGQTGSAGAEQGGGNVEYLFEAKIVAMPGGVLTSILKGLTSLMATEGDRRRLRIELERKKRIDEALSGDNKVVSIAQKRSDVFKREARS